MPTTLLWLNPRSLHRDDDNVRRDTGDVQGLAQTMQQYGVLQPLGVRRDGTGYTVIYGNRRREAALLAGLDSVPCLLVDDNRGDGVVRQLLENVQRQQLNDLDQARALRRLLAVARAQTPDATDGTLFEQVGSQVGLSATTVQRYLNLLDLAPGVQAALSDGSLAVTQAQHLRAIKDGRRQEEVAAYAVREHLSAAQVSRLCAVLIREPHMNVDAAADRAASKRALGPVPTENGEATPPAKLPRRPRVEEEADSDADLWGPDGVATGEQDDRPPSGSPVPGATADGNRRFRIRTVASFCDEVDRLARSMQDGDVLRASNGDSEAPMRLRLALKQLRFTTRALEELAQQQGWIE